MDEFVDKNIKNLINQKKTTVPFLTKYEKAKILGLRIQQLDMGALTTLDKAEIEGLNSNILIAEKELKLKKTPLIIRRRLPNNKNEYWHVRDLVDLE